MYIINSVFSDDELILLNFILSQPFPERDKTVEYINQLTGEDIVRDFSPYYMIFEFRTKDILPGYSSGLRKLTTARVQHPNSNTPTVFTLYEKDGFPFEFEIFNADSCEIKIDTILDGEVLFE